MQLGELLKFAREVKSVPRAVPPDETKSETELQTEIEESDRALSANNSDAGLQARFGRAFIDRVAARNDLAENGARVIAGVLALVRPS